MCAQCAVVAVAAIGAVGVFREQIRARIDRAVGMEAEEDRPTATRGMPPALLLLLIIAALADMQHGPVPAGSALDDLDEPMDSLVRSSHQ